VCGFVGVWEQGHPLSERVVEDMAEAVAHRGPDARGAYFDHQNGVGLGFRRLSIIDLSEKGNQPLGDASGSKWIVMNGEIYNYQTLREELGGSKIRFRSHTDTETVLYSFVEYGRHCLERFHGMFAMAIWDSVKRELFLARDRLGIKPLYYYDSPACFMFASEIKALLRHPRLSRELDHDALDDYLTYGYVPYDKAIIKGIKKLPAGHYLVKNDSGIKIERYWQLRYRPQERSERQLLEELNGEMIRAVNLWTVSDVPVGVFLSGGLDSSALCSLLHEEKRREIRSFSIGFDDQSRDETPYARSVAAHFQMPHFEKRVGVGDARTALNRLSFVFDEPFLDTSSVPTYYLARLASGDLKVVLSGDGGDELFFGYSRYRTFGEMRGNTYPALFSRPLLALINGIKRLPFLYRSAAAERYVSGDPRRIFFWLLCFFDRWEKRRIFNLEVREDKEALWLFDKFYDEQYGLITALRMLDIHTYLVDDILVKVDRTTMANSLEARPAFLEHQLVEYIFTIPDHFFLKQGQQKYILKRSLEDKLPPEIIYRKKKGFGAPIIHWFDQGLAHQALSQLQTGCLVRDGLLNFRELRRMIRYVSKRRWYKLWAVLILEEWYRRWICGEAGQP
jgi:asparagine synthase (glutamine-hydrolysing)